MAVACGTGFGVVDILRNLASIAHRNGPNVGFAADAVQSLFWRGVADGHVAVSMQAFDDASRFSFVEEIFIDEKPSTYSFANETRKMTGAEIMAAYAANHGEAGHG